MARRLRPGRARENRARRLKFSTLLCEIAALAPELSADYHAAIARIVDHPPKEIRLLTAPPISDESGTRPHHQRAVPLHYRRQYLGVVLSEIVANKPVGLDESDMSLTAHHVYEWQTGQVVDRELLIRAAEAPVLDRPDALSGALVETPDLPVSAFGDRATRLRKNTAGLARAARLDRVRKQRATQTLVKSLAEAGLEATPIDQAPVIRD